MNSYLQLFLSGIQPGGKTAGNCTVVAFTSSLPQEGVSYVTQSFAVELARRTGRRTAIVDVGVLQQVDIYHYSQAGEMCLKTDVPNLYVLQPEEETLEENSQNLQPVTGGSEFDRGLSNLQTLRYSFDFVLLDCRSLKDSGDAALFAPVVDGVVVVVEAERTRKEQVRATLNTIEMAQGNLLGCVLNKRQYPIPEWLYQRL
jgi:protein-tyrosine kinase